VVKPYHLAVVKRNLIANGIADLGSFDRVILDASLGVKKHRTFRGQRGRLGKERHSKQIRA